MAELDKNLWFKLGDDGTCEMNLSEVVINGRVRVISDDSGQTEIDGAWVSATSGSKTNHRASFRVLSRPGASEETGEQSQRRLVAQLAENNYGPGMQNGGLIELKTSPGLKVKYHEGIGFYPSTNGARYRQVRLVNAERSQPMPHYQPVLADERGNVSINGDLNVVKDAKADRFTARKTVHVGTGTGVHLSVEKGIQVGYGGYTPADEYVHEAFSKPPR